MKKSRTYFDVHPHVNCWEGCHKNFLPLVVYWNDDSWMRVNPNDCDWIVPAPLHVMQQEMEELV